MLVHVLTMVVCYEEANIITLKEKKTRLDTSHVCHLV